MVIMAKKKQTKSEASAVAKPKRGATHEVSVEEREDQPSDEQPDWAEDGPEADTKKEESYYESEYETSEEDAEEEKDYQRKKEAAKYRGAAPDRGASSDDASSSPLKAASPVKDARKKARELSRDIKATRDFTATKRAQGSAVANHSTKAPKGSAVAEPSSKGSPVASSDKRRRTSERPAHKIEERWYARRDVSQSFCTTLTRRDVESFRDRQKRKGDPNQRNGELHFPQSVWTVDRDCPAEEIDENIFGNSAKHPHVLVIFVDAAIGEQSKAYDHLCTLAEEGFDERITMSDSKKRRTSFSGPKKCVHRLGREEATYGFVVIHNGRVRLAMYDDHESLHKGSNECLRFGTLHVTFTQQCEPNEATLCIGIVSIRRPASGSVHVDSSDAQVLATWTQQETHDMVIACTGRKTTSVEFWQYFANISNAVHNFPVYQPLKKPVSAVATTASGAAYPFKPDACDLCACPQMLFLYGQCSKVFLPSESDIKPFEENVICEGRLRECLVEPNEIPNWRMPGQRKDLQHRQPLGEVSVKAILWDKSPSFVLPFNTWFDYPSKTITKSHNDSGGRGAHYDRKSAATSAAKGKGKDKSIHKDKGKGTDKGKGKSTDKDKGESTDKEQDKRTRLQQSQQQRMKSVTETMSPCPPPVPPPAHVVSRQQRKRSPSPHPRGRSPRRVHGRVRAPSESSSPCCAASCSDALSPGTKRSAVATAKDVRRPNVTLVHNRHPKAAKQPVPRAASSPSPSPVRHPTVKRKGTIAQEFPHSKARQAQEDPVARAKFVADHKEGLVRDYRQWKAEQSRPSKEELGPQSDDSACSEHDEEEEEDDDDETGILEEVDVECERDHQPARVTMVPRGSSGREKCPPWAKRARGGHRRRRSRWPKRTWHTNPSAGAGRHSSDSKGQRAPPWKQQGSSGSQSSRAKSPVREFTPCYRDRHHPKAAIRPHAKATKVVHFAKTVTFGK